MCIYIYIHIYIFIEFLYLFSHTLFPHIIRSILIIRYYKNNNSWATVDACEGGCGVKSWAELVYRGPNHVYET